MSVSAKEPRCVPPVLPRLWLTLAAVPSCQVPGVFVRICDVLIGIRIGRDREVPRTDGSLSTGSNPCLSALLKMSSKLTTNSTEDTTLRSLKVAAALLITTLGS